MKRIKLETVLTLIIGVMGVFVSWKAYEICRLQAKIDKNSHLPSILVKECQNVDDKTKEVNSSYIEISNSEGKLNNYRSKIVTFLECEYIDENLDLYKVNVPVPYYFIGNNLSGNNQGLIETKTSANNAAKMQKLQKEVLEFNKKQECESLNIEEQSCISISFLDMLDEEQNLYYRLNINKSEKIEEDEGTEIFKLQDTMTELGYGIFFDRSNEITVEYLIETIKEISKHERYNNIVKETKKKNIFENEDILGQIFYITSICFQVTGALILLIYTCELCI